MGGLQIAENGAGVLKGLIKPKPSARITTISQQPDFWKTEGQPTVVLVDSFKDVMGLPVSPGEMSATAYESTGANVKRVDSENSANGISLALKSLLSHIKKTGDKPKLVQISNAIQGRDDISNNFWGPIGISEILGRKITNLKELTPDDIAKLRQAEKAKVITRQQNTTNPLFVTDNMSTVESIEELVREDVPVIVDAGNNGPEGLNMFSIAKGAKSAGSLDNTGKSAEYSGNNPFVKNSETPFGIKQGTNGYEITDDPDKRIPLTSLSATKFGLQLLQKK